MGEPRRIEAQKNERRSPETLEEIKARGRSIIEAWYAEQQRSSAAARAATLRRVDGVRDMHTSHS